MFCDDLANDKKILWVYKGFEKIQALIRDSQKFSLARDFAVAADGLVDNTGELLRIAPFCRIPYPVTWIEFRQADRAHWRDAPLHYPGLQSQPGSLAFLCVAHNPKDLTHWTTMLMWQLKDPSDKIPFNASIIALDVDLNVDETHVHRALSSEAIPTEWRSRVRAHALPGELTGGNSGQGFGPYCFAVPTPHLSDLDLGYMPKQWERFFGDVCGSDWAGEVSYLFSVLALINTHNVAETTKPDLTKLNRARVRSRKLPLYEYKVLRVRSAHKASLLPAKTSDTARSGEIRGHFVKGHWKVRRTGIFFWGPHRRGGRGFINKTYELT